VIVVKSGAARRLAPRDLDAALLQVADIEAVGRQALTEIREAVSGYREVSLSTELDRARSALTASDIEVVVQETGPPLPPQTEALLGWVVREGVTNVVRHSRASRATIELRTGGGHAHLTITDNGTGSVSLDPALPPRLGTGLRGLTERLAAARRLTGLRPGPGRRLPGGRGAAGGGGSAGLSRGGHRRVPPGTAPPGAPMRLRAWVIGPRGAPTGSVRPDQPGPGQGPLTTRRG